MPLRSAAAFLFFVISAPADPRWFDNIHNHNTVTLLLPNGQCDAKVERRDIDQLILRLKKTTDACGKRRSLISVSRVDVQDVEDNRPPRQRGQHRDRTPSPASNCAALGTAIVAGTAGLAVGETGSGAGAIAVMAGGGVVSAILCHGVFFPREPRYSVVTAKIVPSWPAMRRAPQH